MPSPVISDPTTAVTAIALLVLPVLAGALIGYGLRQVLGRRLGGVPAGLVLFVLPLAAASGLWFLFPVIGLWDVPAESLLFGLGLFIGAHRVMSDPRNVGVLAGGIVLAAVVLEIGCRVILPQPPQFPVQGGVHLFLRDALRVESRLQAWDTRSKDIVCAGVYGSGYRRMFDESAQGDVLIPQSWPPGEKLRRRVLHVGDSMTYGFGVARDKTFTALLSGLEPGVEQINGAVPGIAPDSYFTLIGAWVRERRPDLAVMYIFEANDLDGLDSDFPCCRFQPLLRYGPDDRVRLNCPSASSVELERAGFAWLRVESPPPYLARVLVDVSAAAAWISESLMLEPFFQRNASTEARLEHLKSILATERDDLKTAGVSFAVVVLPSPIWVQAGKTWQHHAPRIMEIAAQLGIPAFDASEPLRRAEAEGPTIYLVDNHFSEHGHKVVADWLHAQLAEFFINK